MPEVFGMFVFQIQKTVPTKIDSIDAELSKLNLRQIPTPFALESRLKLANTHMAGLVLEYPDWKVKAKSVRVALDYLKSRFDGSAVDLVQNTYPDLFVSNPSIVVKFAKESKDIQSFNNKYYDYGEKFRKR